MARNIVGAKQSEKKDEKTVDKQDEKVLQPSLNKPSANTPSAKRKPRKPLHQQKRIFFRDSEEGFYYRIVNDRPGRIHSFKDAGFEIVEGKNQDSLQGTYSSNQMGSTAAFDVGDGQVAYRMRIPREQFEADNAARIEETKKIDREIDGEDVPRTVFQNPDGDSVNSNSYFVKK